MQMTTAVSYFYDEDDATRSVGCSISVATETRKLSGLLVVITREFWISDPSKRASVPGRCRSA